MPSQDPPGRGKCPKCSESVSLDAKKCPHCGADIALAMMLLRDPRAFVIGAGVGLLGALVGLAIHWSLVRDAVNAFRSGSGCCMCLTTPMVFIAFGLLAIYAAVGFGVGYGIARHKK